MSTESSSPLVISIYSKKFQALARWVVLLVLWVIIFSIAMGKAGIANFVSLIQERNVLLLTVEDLSKQNEELEKTLHDLKTSRFVSERYLKQNFGYVEQDEYVIQFKKKPDGI